MNSLVFEGRGARASLTVPDVGPWTRRDPGPPRPHRDVVSTTRAPRSTPVTIPVGFRRVEVGGHELLVNGRPVLVKGVNRHDHDPERGQGRDARVDRARHRVDEAARAQRGAHVALPERRPPLRRVRPPRHVRRRRGEHRDPRVPAQPQQGPGLGRRHPRADHPHGDPRRQPPSVIVWSLGNESGGSPAHQAAAAWLRAWDPSQAGAVRGSLGRGSSSPRGSRDPAATMAAPTRRVRHRGADVHGGRTTSWPGPPRAPRRSP